ncbi:hypothetical protein Ddc_21174 [Ditylenchus destructor]|nr:hypothetical protein Ddc_21174 [Ditylenchus destructor]
MALINPLAIVLIVFLPIISAGCDYQKCADLANGKDPNFAKFISRPFFSSKQFHNNKFVTGSYHTVAERFQAHITMYCQDVNELSECLRNCPGPREEVHHSQNGISSAQLFIHYSEILAPVCENSTG